MEIREGRWILRKDGAWGKSRRRRILWVLKH